jgi:hypothetical protein
MGQIADIVIDCAHPATLARFWAEVLDGYEIAPYDEEELARLRANGIDDPEDDPTVLIQGPPGRPRVWCTRVPEAKTVKNRVHLDLRADQPESELTRLTHLGARVTAEFDNLTVLEDIEGNEFCLLKVDD